MRILFIILFFSIINFTFSQDIDIYRKGKDDNINTTVVPSGMSNKEFHLLSTNLRLKDMMYAVIVPGYVHFKADEKVMAYSILGARTIGYVGLGVAYYSVKSREDGLIDVEEAEDGSDIVIIGDGWEVKKSDIIMVASATLIVTTYLFDWIRGDAILKRKQNRIRYKYSMKKELYNTYSAHNAMSYIPIAQLSIKL